MSNKHEPADAPDALAVSSEEMTLRQVRRLLADTADERDRLAISRADWVQIAVEQEKEIERFKAQIRALRRALRELPNCETAGGLVIDGAVSRHAMMEAVERITVLPLLKGIANDVD